MSLVSECHFLNLRVMSLSKVSSEDMSDSYFECLSLSTHVNANKCGCERKHILDRLRSA